MFVRETRLVVKMNLGGSATMPRSEQHTATATFVLYVLERVHEVGNAA